MSVVEAMQMGLVPVVTPAGEIRTYCVHNENAILVQEDDRAVEDILRVIESEASYPALQSAAIAQWASAKLYCESMLDASNELLAEFYYA